MLTIYTPAGTVLPAFHVMSTLPPVLQSVLPRFQGVHAGSFLFRKAIEHIKQLHPAPCRMELHVNRHNKAVKFYERMGMRKLREGDFEIGGGFYMNDYIMGLEI
jgi:GNAT superfamily N-acetyltransferase